MGRPSGHMTPVGTSNLRLRSDDRRLPLGGLDSSKESMGEKLRMRAWLEKHIENGSVMGLDWVDKGNSIFRIPWRHGSLKGWTINDVDIFKKWAMHTDKYDSHFTDTKRWKANFRCALNSLPDVERVTNLKSFETKGKNAYRIFRFLPEKKRKRRTLTRRTSTSTRFSATKSQCTCQTNVKCEEQDMCDQGTDYIRASVAKTYSPADSTMPSTSYHTQSGVLDKQFTTSTFVRHKEEVETQDAVDDSNLSDRYVIDLIDRLSNDSNSPQPSPTISFNGK